MMLLLFGEGDAIPVGSLICITEWIRGVDEGEKYIDKRRYLLESLVYR